MLLVNDGPVARLVLPWRYCTAAVIAVTLFF